MKAVGVKILKNKLSGHVRLAESGETVLVTDHDRVVAEPGPVALRIACLMHSYDAYSYA